MIAKVIPKERLVSELESLKDAYRVIVPVQEGDLVLFSPLEKGTDPVFSFQNTRLSPKFLLEPQSERMFRFTLDPGSDKAGIVEEIEGEIPSQLIVGIRPCDAKAVHLVKQNFDSPEYKDPFWLRRYEKSVFFGLACLSPCASCFCTSVGCGPFHEEGLDALLVEVGDSYLIRALTEKGEAVLTKMEGKDAGAADVKALESLKKDAEGQIRSHVPVDGLAAQDLKALFGADFWEDVAFSCINCGTCTYLCPTCWCFDIQDETRNTTGVRMRNWDSCMFPLFTLHGSGHNPRDQKVQRVRQRFMHKLKYFVDKYGGGVACVGCGRCVQYCPVNIDIRRVFEKMNAYVPSAEKSA